MSRKPPQEHAADAPGPAGDRGLGALPRVRLVLADAPLHSRREPIRQAIEVYELFVEEASGWDRERFLAVLLDGRHRIIAIDEVAVGTMTTAIVHPRELFKAAILAQAAAVIVVHNHPSGDPEPSAEDIALTKRLVEAGDIIGIQVLDHVVIAGRRYRSFSEEGRI